MRDRLIWMSMNAPPRCRKKEGVSDYTRTRTRTRGTRGDDAQARVVCRARSTGRVHSRMATA